MTEISEIKHNSMAAALADPATVTPDGVSLAKVPFGSTSHPSKTHVDDRGTVTELFDTRWNWHPAPVDFAYTYTIREGRAKGWGLHREHEDVVIEHITDQPVFVHAVKTQRARAVCAFSEQCGFFT